MRNPFRVWEPGDEQMSHRRAAVLAVTLALLGVIGLSLCSSPEDCKAAASAGSSDCGPAPVATTLG